MSTRTNRRVAAAMGAFVLMALLLAGGCSASRTPDPRTVSPLGSSAATGSVPAGLTEAQATYAADWRRAWADQGTWTRLVLVGVADDSPATPAAIIRLTRTASDMQELMAPYYGEAKVKYFGGLMTTNTVETVALIKAVKAGDTAGIAASEKALYANAAQIAAFLSKENPNIDPAGADNMLKMRVALTKQEIVDRIGKRYSADIGDYDAVQAQARQMSDRFSNAIIRQFPKDFQ